MSTADTAAEIRSFHIEVPDEQIDNLRLAHRGDALADQGTGL